MEPVCLLLTVQMLTASMLTKNAHSEYAYSEYAYSEYAYSEYAYSIHGVAAALPTALKNPSMPNAGGIDPTGIRH